MRLTNMSTSLYPFPPTLPLTYHRRPLAAVHLRPLHRRPLAAAHLRPLHHQPIISRRSLLLLSTSLPLSNPSSPPPPSPDITVTDRVYLDLSVCPSYFRPDRSLADDPSTCPDARPLGRLVLGLYGKLLPHTVANFRSMCIGNAPAGAGVGGPSYRGTLVHKVLPGQYFAGGRQGLREKGEVHPPLGLPANPETVDSKSFVLKHLKPGTLSLCLSENDDEEEVRLDPDYRNVEFLITTGPGPCPQLDDRNIVFGSVLDGMDVVTSIAAIPTFKPSERIRQFNEFAAFLGDERAQTARSVWDRPLETIYISDCGELKVAKPSLTPSLP